MKTRIPAPPHGSPCRSCSLALRCSRWSSPAPEARRRLHRHAGELRRQGVAPGLHGRQVRPRDVQGPRRLQRRQVAHLRQHQGRRRRRLRSRGRARLQRRRRARSSAAAAGSSPSSGAAAAAARSTRTTTPSASPRATSATSCRPDSIVCDVAQPRRELDCVDGKLVADAHLPRRARLRHAPRRRRALRSHAGPRGRGVPHGGQRRLRHDQEERPGLHQDGQFKTTAPLPGRPSAASCPGNYSVRCDKSIVVENEACTEEGAISVHGRGQAGQVHATGKFAIDKTWKPKKGETCDNRYRVSLRDGEVRSALAPSRHLTPAVPLHLTRPAAGARSLLWGSRGADRPAARGGGGRLLLGRPPDLWPEWCRPRARNGHPPPGALRDDRERRGGRVAGLVRSRRRRTRRHRSTRCSRLSSDAPSSRGGDGVRRTSPPSRGADATVARCVRRRRDGRCPSRCERVTRRRVGRCARRDGRCAVSSETMGSQ